MSKQLSAGQEALAERLAESFREFVRTTGDAEFCCVFCRSGEWFFSDPSLLPSDSWDWFYEGRELPAELADAYWSAVYAIQERARELLRKEGK